MQNQTAAKPERNAEKIGVQGGQGGWGRGLPRNPRCKEAMERGRVTAQALPPSGDRHTSGGAAAGGGAGTRNWGTARDGGPPGGGSAPQQCGAGGRGARSLYSAAVGVSAPFPPPEAPPPRRWPGRPHTYANMERGIGSAPLPPLRDPEVSPLPPPQVLDRIRWMEGMEGVSRRSGGNDNPREA